MDKKTVIKKKLAEFKSDVSKDYPIKKMILFGSRAGGKQHMYSDVDLIIVSPKFKKLDFIQRGAKMYDYWKLKLPVDFLCYSPEEFKKLSKQVSIVSEAVKDGTEIK